MGFIRPNLDTPQPIICLNIRLSKPSHIWWNKYSIRPFAFPDSDLTSPPTENKHNHGSCWQSRPQAPHRRTCILQWPSRLLVYNSLNKRICLRGWLERVYGPQKAPMSWHCIIAIIKEHFEGHRPSHTWRKAYPLAQGMVPYWSDVSVRDLGVVGESLWPSKCSYVMVMHHCHNKGAFWGTYIFSSPEKNISYCSGNRPLSIQRVGTGLKVFYGVLWGRFCQQWPWWWWLAVVGCWVLVPWCLHQHKSTVGIYRFS